MGGREALTGFLYQGFASVLEALCQEEWDKISVEFPTPGDKVDINLEKDGINVKSIQVKSTTNTFSKSSLIEWMDSLIKDVDSQEYELFLIGQCENKAITFINSIEKYRKGTINETVKHSLEEFNNKEWIMQKNIKFVILPFDPNILEAIVRDALHRYIYENGDHVMTFDQLDFIASATVTKHMLSSTKKQYISRDKFNHDLKKHIDVVLKEYSKKRITIGVKSFIHDMDPKIDETLSWLNLTEKFEGRLLKNEYDWNEDIYNNLLEYLRENTCRQQAYKIYLQTHLSIAFSVGRILDSKSGINIYPIQDTTGGMLWDVKLSNHETYDYIIDDYKELDEGLLDSVLILNVTRNIVDEVKQYIEEEKLPIGGMIDCYVGDKKSSNFSIEDGTHAAILANSTFNVIKKRTNGRKGGTLHIFASAPNGFMFFLGQNSKGFGKCILYEYNYEQKIGWSYKPSIKFID